MFSESSLNYSFDYPETVRSQFSEGMQDMQFLGPACFANWSSAHTSHWHATMLPGRKYWTQELVICIYACWQKQLLQWGLKRMSMPILRPIKDMLLCVNYQFSFSTVYEDEDWRSSGYLSIYYCTFQAELLTLEIMMLPECKSRCPLFSGTTLTISHPFKHYAEHN